MPINLTKIIIGGAATTICAGGIYAIEPIFSKSTFKQENLKTNLPPLNEYKNVLSDEKPSRKPESKNETVKVSTLKTSQTQNFDNYLPKGGQKDFHSKKSFTSIRM